MRVKNLSRNFRQAMAKSVLVAAALVGVLAPTRSAGYFSHK